MKFGFRNRGRKEREKLICAEETRERGVGFEGSFDTAILNMIYAILIVNNHGKPRLTKFFDHHVHFFLACIILFIFTFSPLPFHLHTLRR